MLRCQMDINRPLDAGNARFLCGVKENPTVRLWWIDVYGALLLRLIPRSNDAMNFQAILSNEPISRRTISHVGMKQKISIGS